MDHLAEFSNVSVNRELGFQLLGSSDGVCRVSMPATARHLQGEGRIQGGILAALADTAAVYLLLPRLGAHQTCTSIEFKLNFLGPARAGAGDMVATGRVKKQGRTIAVCTVEVEQAGEAIATGLFTYLFLERSR